MHGRQAQLRIDEPVRERRSGRRRHTPALEVWISGRIYRATDWSPSGIRLEGEPLRLRAGDTVTGRFCPPHRGNRKRFAGLGGGAFSAKVVRVEHGRRPFGLCLEFERLDNDAYVQLERMSPDRSRG